MPRTAPFAVLLAIVVIASSSCFWRGSSKHGGTSGTGGATVVGHTSRSHRGR